jgi:hypothetical protein
MPRPVPKERERNVPEGDVDLDLDVDDATAEEVGAQLAAIAEKAKVDMALMGGLPQVDGSKGFSALLFDAWDGFDMRAELAAACSASQAAPQKFQPVGTGTREAFSIEDVLNAPPPPPPSSWLGPP